MEVIKQKTVKTIERLEQVETLADHNLILVGDEDGALRVFHQVGNEDYTQSQSIAIGKEFSIVSAICKIPKLDLVVIAKNRGFMGLYKIVNNKLELVTAIQTDGEAMRRLICDSESNNLFGHTDSNNLVFWEFDEENLTYKQTYTLKGHNDPICQLCYDQKHKTIFSGDREGEIKIWVSDENGKFEESQSIKLEIGVVFTLCVDEENRRLFSGTREGGFQTWKFDEKSFIAEESFNCKNAVRISEEFANCVVYVPELKVILSGCFYGRVIAWRMDEQSGAIKKIKTLEQHTDTVLMVRYDAKRGRLVSSANHGHYGGNIKVLETHFELDEEQVFEI